MKWSGLSAGSVLVFPALLGVVALVVLVGAMCGVHLLWNEPALTMAEAAALKDRGTIQRLIWEGVDPNVPASVRPGILTDDERVVTPLEASMGTRTPVTMEFLLAHGARMDARLRAVMFCLATEEEAGEILEVLNKDAAAGKPDCEQVEIPWSRD